MVNNLKLLHCDLSRPSSLTLTGDVEIILDARCQEADLRQLPIPPFAIGGAAMTRDAKTALRQLGEFIALDGRAIWTPSGGDLRPRLASAEDKLFTPFLISWDGVPQATFTFETEAGVSMLALYQALFVALTELGTRPALIAVSAVCQAMSDEIMDKVMQLSPIPSHAPPTGQQIVAAEQIDAYFARNQVQARREGDAQLETLCVMGFGANLPLATADMTAFLKKAFYLTPGTQSSDAELIHNHAIVLRQAPHDPIFDDATAPEQLTRLISTLGEEDILSMTHIENNTRLRRGVVSTAVVSVEDISSDCA